MMHAWCLAKVSGGGSASKTVQVVQRERTSSISAGPRSNSCSCQEMLQTMFVFSAFGIIMKLKTQSPRPGKRRLC